MTRPEPAVPVLLVRIGSYPLNHGTVEAVRSLGRWGVPVHAMVESLREPTAHSRYLARRIRSRTTGEEDQHALGERVRAIAARLGGRPVAVAIDDEAAVLLAERGRELRQSVRLPAVAPDLPRSLASKHDLSMLCHRVGVPAARSVRPQTLTEVIDAGADLGFPLVIKNDRVWSRLVQPGVPNTTIVRDAPALRALVAQWRTLPSVIVQEYLPPTSAGDWMVNGYFSTNEAAHVVLTGRKLRSWPPAVGPATRSITADSPDLARLTVELCQGVGFRGVCDLDWRFDARDGRYKLVDFNPRLGAQFRLFARDDGLDILRAMYLDLTGGQIPAGRPLDGHEYVVENGELMSALADRRAGRRLSPRRVHSRDLAWWAFDDPLPALTAAGYSVATLAKRVARRRRAGPQSA
jgi:predicted ATP-grasp superfamily ATP-dependent carboligase